MLSADLPSNLNGPRLGFGFRAEASEQFLGSVRIGIQSDVAEFPVDHGFFFGKSPHRLRKARERFGLFDVDENHNVVKSDTAVQWWSKGRVERVVKNDRRLCRLDLPRGQEADRSVSGDLWCVEVDLVFECDSSAGYLRKVHRVFPGSRRKLVDECGIGSHFFKNGEVFEPDGGMTGSRAHIAWVMSQCELTHNCRSANLALVEVSAYGFDDRCVETGLIHLRVLDDRVHQAAQRMRWSSW